MPRLSSSLSLALFAAGCLVLAACGAKFGEPYSGPGKLPGTWYHEVAGFSDYPHTDTYEFRADGVLVFRYESSKYPSAYSWTGKWQLRKDSLITTQDSCGLDPETQAVILVCPLPYGYDVRWDPAAQRVYQLSENGIIYWTYSR